MIKAFLARKKTTNSYKVGFFEHKNNLYPSSNNVRDILHIVSKEIVKAARMGKFEIDICMRSVNGCYTFTNDVISEMNAYAEKVGYKGTIQRTDDGGASFILSWKDG